VDHGLHELVDGDDRARLFVGRGAALDAATESVPKLVGEDPCRREPVAARRRDAPKEHVDEGARQAVPNTLGDPRAARSFVAGVDRRELAEIAPEERECQSAYAVHVRACVGDDLGGELLGRERTEERRGGRRGHASVALDEEPSEGDVGEEDALLRRLGIDEDPLGPERAVHHALAMRGLEGVEHLGGEIDGRGPWEAATPRAAKLVERVTRGVLGDHHGAPSVARTCGEGARNACDVDAVHLRGLVRPPLEGAFTEPQPEHVPESACSGARLDDLVGVARPIGASELLDAVAGAHHGPTRERRVAESRVRVARGPGLRRISRW
jgi:hypothetical protein